MTISSIPWEIGLAGIRVHRRYLQSAPFEFAFRAPTGLDPFVSIQAHSSVGDLYVYGMWAPRRPLEAFRRRKPRMTRVDQNVGGVQALTTTQRLFLNARKRCGVALLKR